MRRAFLLALLLSGCQARFHSEQGQWGFEDPELAAEANTGFGDDMPLLAQTEVCPTPYWELDEVAGWTDVELFATCVSQGIQGDAAFTQDGACLQVGDAGEVVWTLDPLTCDAPFAAGQEPVADRVVLTVVDPSAVSAHLDPWADDYALANLDLVPQDVLTADALPPEGEPWLLLEGTEVWLYAQLLDEAGQPVGWRGSEGGFAVDGTAERLDDEGLPGGWIGLRLAAGDEASLTLQIRDQAWTLGSVMGVAVEDIASLDVVVAFAPTEAGGQVHSPWAARALLRDAGGWPILGAPVQWSVLSGRLAVEPGPGDDTRLPGPDYAWVTDACQRPSRTVGARHAVLEASYAGFTDHVELDWTMTEEMVGDDEGWEPDAHCTGPGCGCASGGSQRSGALLLALALPLLALRRRLSDAR
ncbi:MAG: hypothetical protein ABIO70_18615 [Pseudomonadota bacterium]